MNTTNSSNVQTLKTSSENKVHLKNRSRSDCHNSLRFFDGFIQRDHVAFEVFNQSSQARMNVVLQLQKLEIPLVQIRAGTDQTWEALFQQKRVVDRVRIAPQLTSHLLVVSVILSIMIMISTGISVNIASHLLLLVEIKVIFSETENNISFFFLLYPIIEKEIEILLEQ